MENVDASTAKPGRLPQIKPNSTRALQKRKVGKRSLKQKRQNKSATKIQTRWRQKLARKCVAEQKAQLAIKSEKQVLETFRKVPFDKLQRVSFYVDGAVGLPSNCTVTRVTGRLLSKDRQEVTTFSSVESYSDPQSPCSNPAYDLFISWKALDLDPSLTVLCFIDTLERIELKPRTVGYAALKLCMKEDGQQPGLGYVGQTYLNAGRFSVPILLGSIPSQLTEEMLEDRPVMPNAAIIVRLFDASMEAPMKQEMPSRSLSVKMNTVAEVLYATYDNPLVVEEVEKRGVPELPLWDSVGSNVEMGREVHENDWRLLRPLLTQWMPAAFPPLTEMRHALNLKYALRYADNIADSVEAGCHILAGVDMLYNMSFRKNRDVRPNTVVGCKVHFSYLRANRNPLPVTDDISDPQYFMDDVSRRWDLEASVAQCPVYVDDFTAISGMDLGADACLLVLVTRVDITFTSETSYDLDMPFRHPVRSWWGILPLRTDSPFYAPQGSSVAEAEIDGAYVNAGTHQVPLFQGIPPLEVMQSYDPFDTVLTILRRSQAEDSAGCFGCTSSNVAASVVDVAPYPSEFDPPFLSPCGASAIVRVVDAKMVRFCSNHIKVDHQELDTTYLKAILRAEGGGRARAKSFKYHPLKFESCPSVAKAMLPAFQKDPGLLTDAINAKSEADVQEYVNSLP